MRAFSGRIAWLQATTLRQQDHSEIIPAMKAILAILLTILLGIGIGVGIATLRIQNAKWTPKFDARGGAAASSSADLAQPPSAAKP
jgi:hypothetical protein